RAWVMQERILSSRTIHFAGQQVFWQCREQESCEVFPDGLPTWVAPLTAFFSRWTNVTGFRKALDKLGNYEQQSSCDSHTFRLYNGWHKLVEAYTTCGLTKEEDKLVAIFGLVKEL